MKKPVKSKRPVAKQPSKPGAKAPTGSELDYGKFGGGKVTDRGKKK